MGYDRHKRLKDIVQQTHIFQNVARPVLMLVVLFHLYNNSFDPSQTS